MEISCLFSYPIHLLFHLYFGHHSLLHMRYNLKVLAVHGKLCQFIFFFNLKMSSYLSLLKGNFVVYTILDLQLLSLRILKILFNYFLAAQKIIWVFSVAAFKTFSCFWCSFILLLCTSFFYLLQNFFFPEISLVSSLLTLYLLILSNSILVELQFSMFSSLPASPPGWYCPFLCLYSVLKFMSQLISSSTVLLLFLTPCFLGYFVIFSNFIL